MRGARALLTIVALALVVGASVAARADDEPYVSPFADDADADTAAPDGGPAGVDDEPYVSPFAAPDRADERVDARSSAVDEERLRVEEVVFENREYFREETIRGFLTHPIPGALDEAVLESDRMVLEGRYKDRGYLEATVALRLDPGASLLGRKAVFVITAGRRATIRGVFVHGNRDVDADTLLNGMFTKSRALDGLVGDLVVAVTRAGFYHKPFLDQDTQILLKNYYAKGFLEARVDGVRTKATPDLEGIEVHFDVTEGALYELRALVVDGDLPPGLDAAAVRGRFSVADGAPADLVTVQQEGEKFLDEWRRRGHPFAKLSQSFEVGASVSGDPARKGIILRLTVDKGAAARVREVRITGNQGLLYGTMDHVIRRDVQIREGMSYDLTLLEETKTEVMKTGYFGGVETKTLPTDDPGLVDVEVAVVEQPTWLLSIAPAYIASEGPLLLGILGDRNLVGTGIASTLFGTLSFQRQVFDFNIVEPRLLDSRIALQGELHRRLINYPDFILASHVGGGVRLTFPAFFDVYLSSGFTAEYGGVQNYKDTPDYDFVQLRRAELFPFDVFRNVIEISGSLDKRDNPIQPRNGAFLSGSLSYAGPWTLSQVSFLKAEGNARFFWTPFWDITWKSNTRVGGVQNPHGDVVPVTDRFFLGGFGSIRGYFPRSITPTVSALTVDGDDTLVRVGGTRSFVQNLEVEAPVWPGTPLRAFLFVDAGNTWLDEDPVLSLLGEELGRGATLPLGLFWSVGFGVLIQTPLLPFRFEWSVPLTRRASDTRPMDFFFGVGSAF